MTRTDSPSMTAATIAAATSMLDSERSFFDDEAASLGPDELLIPAPRDVERYRRARPGRWRNLAKDELFARLLPLRGKRVLDYGCGHGENACLLAACGADAVTAFDLSPVSIEQARRRAQLHGLADRIRFDVKCAGALDYPPASFDVVTGFAVLHHLHTLLPAVFDEIHRLLKPGGTAAFIEPVANSRTLRFLRRLTPVPDDATPDERQLTDDDFRPLRETFRTVDVAHFHFLRRLRRLTGDGMGRALARIDHVILRIVPRLRRYYGLRVITAEV